MRCAFPGCSTRSCCSRACLRCRAAARWARTRRWTDGRAWRTTRGRRSGTRWMSRLWKKRRREFRRASRRRMSSRWIFVPRKTRRWSPSPVPTPAARRRRSRRSDWRCSWRAPACTSRRTRARPRPCRGPRACWRTWATRRASTSTVDSPRSARTSLACAASSPPRGTRATPWWSCWTSPAAGRTPRRAPRSPPPCSVPRRTGRRSRWPRATTKR
mmetsp:Transcript_11707/g.50159  ORF Transcript_11707/g.50159 Transcript_11707/m.50159 type:complete len:215 (+) Transcript_11707:1195-1839(+)